MSAGDLLARLERIGKAGEDALLAILLTAMIGLAASQIVLRNVFDTGFFWTDELLRMLVLWLAMAGAVAASRSDRHIAISVLDRMIPQRFQPALRALTHAFTAAVCGLLAWHSLAFVRMSHEFGDVLMGSFPAWIAQAILPVGFGLMAWRFGLLTLANVAGRVRETEPHP